MNVLVVFTYGYSLETWNESGTIFRELSIYKKLHDLDIVPTAVLVIVGIAHTLCKFSRSGPTLVQYRGTRTKFSTTVGA